MEFENELTELFDSASATLSPPVEEILEQSSAQGRRLRRRRRGATAALSALSVTAIACGTAFGVTHTRSSAQTPVMAAAGSSTPSANAAQPTQAPTPSTSPRPTTSTPPPPTTKPTPTPTGGASVTDYDVLKSLLPTDANVSPMPYEWGNTTPGAADVIYDDGHGKAEIDVSTTKPPRGPAFSCSSWLGGKDEGPRPEGATPVGCTAVQLSNGDVQTTVVTGVDASGFYDYEIMLKRTDGAIVMATAANGVPEGAKVDVTRVVPPLTIAQLTAIADNPAWHLH